MRLNGITQVDLNLEGVAKKYQSSAGGLNAKGRAHYNKQGHNLKTPVSKKQAKKSPKSAGRRKSFCSRMGGQKKMHNIDCRKDPDKAICKSLKRWDCNEDLINKADLVLNELFDDKLKYEWTRQMSGFWSADFYLMTKLGNTKVTVDIMMVAEPGLWDVAFSSSAKGHEYGSYGIINSGKAYTIFATIMEIINDWIKQMNPEMLMFTAEGNSRIKLYERMIKKYLPAGWTSATGDISDNNKGFIAKKGKITSDDMEYIRHSVEIGNVADFDDLEDRPDFDDEDHNYW